MTIKQSRSVRRRHPPSKYVKTSDQFLMIGMPGFMFVTPGLFLLYLLTYEPIFALLTFLSGIITWICLLLGIMIFYHDPDLNLTSELKHDDRHDRSHHSCGGGRANQVRRNECSVCHGTGRCSSCRGSGLFNYYARQSPSMYSSCSFCVGTGVCTSCNGKGFTGYF